MARHKHTYLVLSMFTFIHTHASIALAITESVKWAVFTWKTLHFETSHSNAIWIFRMTNKIWKISCDPHHIRCCWTYIIRGCCTLGHFCTDEIRGHCAKMCSNNGKQGFLLLHNSGPGHAGCLSLYEKRDRQTRGWAHKVFFAHAQVRRTPKNWCVLLNS
jgi:hypothetical protein